MTLSPGTRLATYEITDALGAGGMGEVYRARDTKLGRSVAIKILPDALAADPERIARFEREAKMLAALNHPHIAALYGMEHDGSRHFLIMELVEGETLAERLQRGAMPVEEALKIAHQIAEALDAAHEKGIVHRDLKPANVKVTPDDKVKVLDFGLAKAMTDDATVGAGLQTGPSAATHSPTLSMMATQAGVILGTAAYMSPEQAKGLPADHRSDVFSFGCVLYEVLTGRQPFQGETAPDVLASVLVRDPDLHALPPNLNPRLTDLLRRCLEKQPRRRWQAVGDLRAEIEAIAAAPRAVPAAPVVVAPPKPLWKRTMPGAIASVLLATVTGIIVWNLKPAAPTPVVVRFSLTLNDGQFTGLSRTAIAISPGGTQIVYVADNRLYRRASSDVDAQPISGIESSPTLATVFIPVFSPDGRFVAFYDGGDRSLKKIAVGGGAPVTLTRADVPFGLSWTGTDILFAERGKGISRVPDRGGKTELLIALANDDVAHGPQMLPDGDHVLFALSHGNEPWDKAQVVVQSLKSKERKTLIDGGADARYLPTGHLVYAFGGVLFAVPFDVRRLEITAGPTPVVEGVRRAGGGLSGAAHYSVSNNGTLIYIPGPATASTTGSNLALIDRNGVANVLKVPPNSYEFPRVSPNGKFVAIGTDDGKDANIWIYELSGGTSLRRLTNGGRNRVPLWSADSQRVLFQSDREGDLGIFWQPADGSGTAERLTRADKDVAHAPETVSPDGKLFLFEATKGLEKSLWSYSFQDKKIAPFGDIRSVGLVINASFSPNGRWVVYNESKDGNGAGLSIYVQPFPPTGARQLIGTAIHPMWSPDGKELLYRQRGQTFSVSVDTTAPTFAFGNPKPVNAGPYRERGPVVERENDMTPDGKNFVAVVAPGTTSGGVAVSQIQVVVNWFEELRQRVPTGR